MVKLPFLLGAFLTPYKPMLDLDIIYGRLSAEITVCIFEKENTGTIMIDKVTEIPIETLKKKLRF